MGRNKHSVFISYRRDDGADKARLIKRELQARGISAFLDVDDLGAAHFDERLLRAIEEIANFVLVLSPKSLHRCRHEGDWLRRELAHAITTGRNVVPLYDPGFVFPPPDELPEDIRDLPRYNSVEYNHTYYDATFKRLVGFLKVDEKPDEEVWLYAPPPETRPGLTHMLPLRQVADRLEVPVFILATPEMADGLAAVEEQAVRIGRELARFDLTFDVQSWVLPEEDPEAIRLADVKLLAVNLAKAERTIILTSESGKERFRGFLQEHSFADKPPSPVTYHVQRDGLLARVREDLAKWGRRWELVPRICRETMAAAPPPHKSLETSADWHTLLNRTLLRHQTLRGEPRLLLSLGEAAVHLYQRHGPAGWDTPLPQPLATRLPPEWTGPGPAQRVTDLRRLQVWAPSHAAAQPLAPEAGGSLTFADPQWFFFFCAYGLVEAISAGKPGAAAGKPYVNPIHRNLAGLFQRENQEGRDFLVRRLGEWLTGGDGITRDLPVTRNFAAYVLGMFGARSAEDALAHAACHDRGEDVQFYAAMSLAKAGSRKHLEILVERWMEAQSARERLVFGQALCRLLGLANYPL